MTYRITYRRLLTSYLALCLSVGGFAVASEAFAHDGAHDSYEDYTLIHAGHVMAVPGEAVLSDQTIIIHDGKIVGIEAGFLDDEDASIIDGHGLFFLPGLIDSHVHLRGEWNPNGRLETFTKEPGDVAFDAAYYARKTLMAGFTAVQDVGGPPEIKALSRAIKAGKVPGPHIRASGNVSITGGHGEMNGGIDAALKAGVKSIEHGTFLDAETTRLFKENDAVLVPTVLAGMTVKDWDFLPPASYKKAQEVGPKMLDMLALAHKSGVTIAFGTDTGVSKHGENAKEFEYMVQAGMSETEAIRAATVVASKHIELDHVIGTLEAGKYADLIGVDGDPRDNISELRDVDFVMKGGIIYKGE